MPWQPEFPLSLKHGSCPYCYDGHVCWDKHAEKFHCSHCNTIILVHNWKEPNGKSL